MGFEWFPFTSGRLIQVKTGQDNKKACRDFVKGDRDCLR